MSSFEEYVYYNIGKRIRHYRELRGITQEKLSQILGMNEKYIGHVERCERYISNKVLIKILNFFQIEPSEFYKFDEIYQFNK